MRVPDLAGDVEPHPESAVVPRLDSSLEGPEQALAKGVTDALELLSPEDAVSSAPA